MELFGWSEEKKERAFRQGLAAYLEKDYRPAIDSLRPRLAWPQGIAVFYGCDERIRLRIGAK